MNISIEITEATRIESYGKDYTTLKIDDLTLEMDNDIAEEIAEKLYRKLKGYYPSDKIQELEHEKFELEKARETLQELYNEETLNK